VSNSAQLTKKSYDPFHDYFENYSLESPDDALVGRRQKVRLNRIIEFKSRGCYVFQQPADSKSGPLISIDGADFKLLSSYDYLGLIGHKKIEDAAVDAIRKFGTGSGGARLLTGTTTLHHKLETELALALGMDAAITFSSGYQANLAVISSLFDHNDLAIVDSKIHQSIIDACKLADLPFRRFEHNDPDSLEQLLKQRGKSKRVLIITEGMFSMDGDVCTLPAIIGLKKKYGAFLMVDEAHSFGVLGKNGAGALSHFGIPGSEIDILTGSLSKAIPASGGFVAASREIVVLLQHASSQYIFSGSLSPSSAATASAALDVIKTETERHARLWDNAEYLRNELKSQGFNTGNSSTPIIPVILGEDKEALQFSRRLFERHVLVPPVLFPAVPKNQSMLRICVTAAHSKTFLTEVVKLFMEVR
jgi:glycine C-acetyltransferase